MRNLRFQIYCSDDYGTHAPEGPGWYITSTQSSEHGVEEIIPRVRLTNKQVVTLAKVFDKQVEGKPLNWAGEPGFIRVDMSAEQAVIEENGRIKAAVDRKLAEAEQALQRFEQLRARASELDDGS